MAKKKETKVKVERSYNIPLRKSFRSTAKHKKTPRAVRTIRQFLEKHMKSENILLGMHLNEHLWKHGIKNPPHHVKVHVIKEDDVVRAELEGFEFKEAAKAEKKKEPKTMKDKLEKKLGVTEGREELAKEEKAAERAAFAKPVEEKKGENKAEEKKLEAAPEKKEEAPKDKVPTAQELAAKKQ
jgi:large subunit ribosomal protein L31e